MNDTTAIIHPKHIGFIRYLVKCSPKIWAEKPVYKVKVVPLEASHGRRALLVQILLDGHYIWQYADARDVVLDGRA